MKALKIMTGIFLVLLLSVNVEGNVEAHPGRTDGNGCHTCRTNCEKWGLSYGEYHCHNGNVSESSSNSVGSGGNDTTYVAPKVEVVQPTIDYETIGKDEGYTFKKNNPNASLGDARYSYEDATYKASFEKAFNTAKEELEQLTKTAAINKGQSDAGDFEDYQLEEIPDTYIKSIYESEYKEAYDKAVEEIKNGIKNTADRHAFAFVFDHQESEVTNSYKLKEYQEYYKKEYENYRNQYKIEKEYLFKTAKINGKKDKQERNGKTYDFLLPYLNTSVYDEAKELYDEAYKKEPSPLLWLYIISAIGLIVFFISLIIVIKKQKNNRQSIGLKE